MEYFGLLLQLLEFSAVLLNLVFLLLLIKEERSCWLFGIFASILSVALFLLLDKPLYSEAILYGFYVLFGIYGYLKWNRENKRLAISEYRIKFHLVLASIALLLTFTLGSVFNKIEDASYPFADAFSTSFSFLATYLEANKILSAWLYWIILNAFTIGLYAAKGMKIYAGLMVVYTILSVFGYREWRKKKLEQI